MTKTFIYGVPNGFDFYEKDAGLNDYFKGFYISSRRGRRLMINRRDNGETIYSYLRYGLKEVSRQPQHSFFGMSLVVDNYQFCPNFKLLLEWFDYLFNKLVNEHNIIKKNDDGILHYVIHKFDENIADVEWLKSNLPNILTKAEKTQLVNYDSSYVDGKAGQVVSFNQPVGENCLLDTFKRYRWISVSSEIVDRQEISVGDPIRIELNFEELNEKLNEFNQQLLPIAVDISKGSREDLKRMDEEVREISDSLAKYLPTIDDNDEAEKFKGLEAKYDSLKSSIGTLLAKISASVTPQPPKPEKQYCFSCKKDKPLSHFRSPEATKCLECEEQERRRNGGGSQAYKTCISCGKKKPVRFFNQPGADICDECAKTQISKKPDPKPSFDKIGKILMSKGFLGAVALLVVIAGVGLAVINLPQGCSTENVASGGNGGGTSEQTGNVTTEKIIDKAELEKLVTANDFKSTYDYIIDKTDAADYMMYIKKHVRQYLLSIINTPQSTKEGVLKDYGKFYVDNFQLLEFIDFGEQDKEQWKQFANDYFFVWGILNSDKITQQEKDIANEILAKYVGLFPDDWMSLLAVIEVETPPQKEGTKQDEQVDKVATGTITVSYTSKDNKQISENISGHREIFIKAGTLVTFNFPDGYIKTKAEISKKEKGKKNKRKLRPMSQVVVYCGEYGITVTPVSRFDE